MKGIETSIETNKEKIEKVSKDGTRRGQNKNSIKNLKPAEKGEVRNPTGRPAGVLDFRQRVELSIKFLSEQYVEKHNADPKNKNKQIDLEQVDIMGDIFAQYMNKARNGELKAIDSLMDRVYGKAKQTVELTGRDGDPIQHEIAVTEAKTKARDILNKWKKKEKIVGIVTEATK